MGKVFRDLFILLLGIGIFVGACVLALHKNPDAPAVASLPVPGGASSAGGATGPDGATGQSASSAMPAASHGHLLYACTRGASVTYMDRPCPAGAKSQMMVVDDPNLYTPTPAAAEVPEDGWPDRATVAGESSASSDSGRLAGRPDTYSPSAPGAECRSIEAEIRSIDERGRQGYSGDEGSRLRDERRKLREQYHALNCSER